jgi:hypothetical protein
MSAKMFIFNTTGMLFVTFLLVLFFLPGLFVFVFVIVVVIVLGKDGDHSCEKHRRANGARRGESFHVKNLALIVFKMLRIRRPGHKIEVTYSRCRWEALMLPAKNLVPPTGLRRIGKR